MIVPQMPTSNALPRPHKAIGWREWVSLPDLGLKLIKAKVDTGARTSALHAFKLEPFTERGIKKIRFCIHPFQRRTDKEHVCVAEIVDHRIVVDSGGHEESRYVVKTKLRMGSDEWPVEVTLTDRDTLRFRMLLGRQAIKGRFVINPGSSYLLGKPLKGNK